MMAFEYTLGGFYRKVNIFVGVAPAHITRRSGQTK